VAKTWAPVGQTPVIRHFDRRDRISVISGLSVSPLRQRLNLYYQLHDHNIRQAEACAFLRHLLQHLRRHVIVLWDRGRPHKGRLIADLCRRVPRLRLERFPAYAPELNPDEGIWKLAKENLANGCPHDRHDLLLAVLRALENTRRNIKNLRGCITQSGLPLFLS
jgi:transposase